MEDVQHHEDVRMEETIAKIDEVRIDDNKNIQEKVRKFSFFGGFLKVNIQILIQRRPANFDQLIASHLISE